MAFSVVMPALEMAQETGKLISWRKKEGESVAKGELLLEVETDKAVMEIESPADGVLAGIRVQEGAVVPVGQTIAWILRPGEAVPSEGVPATSATPSAIAPRPSNLTSINSFPAAEATSARVSPKARRLAKEHGVDLSRIRGSGPGGEILTSDIQAFVESSSATAGAIGAEPLSTIARIMAERTTESWTTVPHFFVVREVDASALVAARERLRPPVEQRRGVKLTYTDLLVMLVADVLVKHPRVNAQWSKQGIHLNSEVNIGLAMAIDDGVVTTVIHNAGKVDLGEIAVLRRDLTERARGGRLRPSDIANATFTISNLGMYEVDAFSAIISPPQAAILAVGSIRDRVVPVDGKPGVRPMITLTLSSDHRVVDGARAAAFLNDVAESILHPDRTLR
ncbi:MAG TPA: dihydrolipoamide acetyltransferase family protein [Terriglobales bacterium]|nr:dihydrolipoamide acetyltransferase family protein [Terriglobales bacterium]